MKNNIQVLKKNSCYGCRSCEQVCPKKCIQMREDNEGFLYPLADNIICSSCGVCTKHCPGLTDTNISTEYTQKVYAAKHVDKQVLNNSSSGGVFSAIAEKVINNGGVIFGCELDSSLKVRHTCVDSYDGLKKLRGSKYVASDLEDSFKEAKKILDTGRHVLFSGCPCHIAGLKAFLNKDYVNLYTCDLICHGTPSPKLFKKYIDYLQDKHKMKITNYEFRNKEKKGWGMNIKISLSNEETSKVSRPICLLDPYYSSFLSAQTYRPSCYSCKYTQISREGDFTLGDYWGIERFHPEIYSPQGVSVLLVNSRKGHELFNSIRENLIYIPSSVEKAQVKNGNLNKPSPRPKERGYIYNDIDNLDFYIYSQKYLNSGNRIISFIKYILPQSLKIKLKKYLLNRK